MTPARILAALAFAAFLSMGTARAQDDADDEASDLPWLTGPILVPGAEMGGKGSLWVQPFFFAGRGRGVYQGGTATSGGHQTTINPQLQIGYGFTNEFEIQIDGQLFWNRAGGDSTFGLGDTSLELHYLALAEDGDTLRPAIRIDYVQLFPTGEYQGLNPSAKGTNTLGSGTYIPTLALNFTKTFALGGEHYLRPDFSVVATLPLDTHVEGTNTYGGGTGTDGTIHPGNGVTFYVSGEYTLTRNWALAFDSTYVYVDTTRFTGNPGTNPDGSTATVGVGSGYQITVLPQIEYNFDDSHGLILGSWISLAGRNTQSFVSGVVSYIVTFDVGTPW